MLLKDYLGHDIKVVNKGRGSILGADSSYYVGRGNTVVMLATTGEFFVWLVPDKLDLIPHTPPPISYFSNIHSNSLVLYILLSTRRLAVSSVAVAQYLMSGLRCELPKKQLTIRHTSRNAELHSMQFTMVGIVSCFHGIPIILSKFRSLLGMSHCQSTADTRGVPPPVFPYPLPELHTFDPNTHMQFLGCSS